MMKMRLQLIILNAIVITQAIKSDKCYPTVDITDGYRYDNYTILYDGILYDIEDYYANGTTIYGCICKKKICINKCCPLNKYSISGTKCLERGNDIKAFKPEIYDRNWKLLDIDLHKDVFINVIEKFSCEKDYNKITTTFITNILKIGILNNGSLFMNYTDNADLDVENYYCMDVFKDNKINARFCHQSFDKNNLPRESERYTRIIAGAGVSIFFMILTLIVFGLVPELRQRRGSILIIFYITTMLIAFSALFVFQLGIVYEYSVRTFCICTTYLVYFFALSAFFWMNILSYDMWHGISAKRRKNVISARRLAYYCLYAFGMPALLTAFSTFMQFGPVEKPWIKPGIGVGCFLRGEGKLLYFNLPMLVICIINCYFFIRTTVIIAQTKKEFQRGMSETKESRCSAVDRDNWGVYFKLFIIMGINWGLESISSLFEESTVYFYISDLFNFLVGFSIFLLFICPKKNLPMYKRRYYKLCGGKTISNSSNATRVTGDMQREKSSSKSDEHAF